MQFDRQIQTALRLIKKNGQKVIWRSLPLSVDDALAPWNGGDITPVNHDVFICFVPVANRSTRQFFQYLTNSEIEIGEIAGLMGNINFEPFPKDVVIRDSKELRISKLDLLSPNGQNILYTIEFSK